LTLPEREDFLARGDSLDAFDDAGASVGEREG